MQQPTANLTQAAQPGGPSFGINTTNNGRIVILGGGIPLVSNGTIVGGIGVSGGTSTQDTEIANAVVRAFEKMDKKSRDSVKNTGIGYIPYYIG
jgi:uncharacterized protein GlcG (DUF336 family)